LLVERLPRLSVDLRFPPPVAGLASLFAAPVDEVWLEIGFGAGEHLLWQAEHHPRVGFLGAEPFVNGVVAALSGALEKNLSDRVRFHADDAIPLLDWLPAASIGRAFLLFPDPWPKKRHRQRRLLAPALLDRLARVLRPEAQLRFATDIADYAEEAEGHALQHPSFDIVHTFSSAHRAAVPDWPVTRYERKAEREKRPSRFLILSRR
jgi:tRNA (guanine-N7-)-methyltransferase